MAFAVAVPTVFNVESLFAATNQVRRSVGGMTGFDPVITDYRNAIKAMRLLPTSNPLSWAYQAAIHGSTLAQNLPAWRSCEHGTYYFWSWHRMYLYWFERIVLFVDLQGNAKSIWRDRVCEAGQVGPSPDGRKVVIYADAQESNMWMMENF
jgi:hypothetical protein